MGVYQKNYEIDIWMAELIEEYDAKGILTCAESEERIAIFQTQSVADFITELMANCFTYLLNEHMVYFEHEIAGAEIIAKLLSSNRAYKRSDEVRKAIAEIKRMKKEVEELREQVVINKVNKELEKTA